MELVNAYTGWNCPRALGLGVHSALDIRAQIIIIEDRMGGTGARNSQQIRAVEHIFNSASLSCIKIQKHATPSKAAITH